MKYKHARDRARGAKKAIVFRVEADAWGTSKVLALIGNEAVAEVGGLYGIVAIKKAQRRILQSLSLAAHDTFKVA